MRQLLSTVLAAHWAAVFMLFAFLSASNPHAGATGMLRAAGWAGTPDEILGNPTAAALVGLCFAVAASLFLWMLAQCLLGHAGAEHSMRSGDYRAAFAVGVVALGAFALAVLVEGAGGATFLAVECLLAAVLISFLAVNAEQLAAAATDAHRFNMHTAQEMALAAAHDTMLSQLAGRSGDAPARRF